MVQNKRPVQGNVFFDGSTTATLSVGGNLGNSILNGCVDRIYGKIANDPSNDAYFHVDIPSDPTKAFKIVPYKRSVSLSPQLRAAMMCELQSLALLVVKYRK